MNIDVKNIKGRGKIVEVKQNVENVSKICVKSKNCVFDVNICTEKYKLKKGDWIDFCISPSAQTSKLFEKEEYEDVEKKIFDEYDYVMCGLVYEQKKKVYQISFGGLVMNIQGKNLNLIKGKYIYLLIKKP